MKKGSGLGLASVCMYMCRYLMRRSDCAVGWGVGIRYGDQLCMYMNRHFSQ